MRDAVFGAAIVLLLLAVLGVQIVAVGGRSAPAVDPEEIRKFAASLESQELYRQAVDEYLRYLETAAVPDEQRANLWYRVGSIHLDELGDYENALAAFLRVSHFYPQSAVAREAEKRMIRCYEGLKRGYDAQKRLERMTDLNPEEEPAGGGPAVAQVGDRTITLERLERDIAAMPAFMRERYGTPEGKREYLRQLVFQELLYDAALRKEYQTDPEVRRAVRDFEKNLLAQKVYEEEIAAKAEAADSAVQLYYEARKDEFAAPDRLVVSHILFGNEEDAREAAGALADGASFEELARGRSLDEASAAEGGRLGTVSLDGDTVPGLGRAPGVVNRLRQLEAGAVSDPVRTGRGVHLFRIDERIPGEVPPLSEIRPQIEAKVRQMREAEVRDRYIGEMLEAEKVKLFERAIPGVPAGPPGGGGSQ